MNGWLWFLAGFITGIDLAAAALIALFVDVNRSRR